jgi:hypothetical protein
MAGPFELPRSLIRKPGTGLSGEEIGKKNYKPTFPLNQPEEFGFIALRWESLNKAGLYWNRSVANIRTIA